MAVGFFDGPDRQLDVIEGSRRAAVLAEVALGPLEVLPAQFEHREGLLGFGRWQRGASTVGLPLDQEAGVGFLALGAVVSPEVSDAAAVMDAGAAAGLVKTETWAEHCSERQACVDLHRKCP